MTAVISPSINMADTETDTSCLPERRIHCSTGKILVGNQEFLSASEALFAYLQQFDSKTRTKKQQDAFDLLVARTKISTRRKQGGVEDEVKENLLALRKKKLKQLLHKKKVEQSGLRKEVEDALSRSADLLDKINDDDTSPVVCASDIGSMSTDLLLSVNPYESSTRGIVVDEDGKRRHVYSYRTPRSRSRTVGSVPALQKADMSRRSSVDSAIPSSVLKQMGKRSSSSGSGVQSRHSDPSDILKRLRSRSASPLPSHLRNSLPRSSHHPPDWVQDLDASSGKSVPSWVQTMDASLDDSVLTHRLTGGRAAPSWIQDAVRSDVTADSLLLNNRRDLSFNKSNLTDSRPGLNFSDLATSGLSRFDKHSFLASHRNEDASKAKSLDESIASKSKDLLRSPGFKVYSAATSSDDKASDLKQLAAEGTQLTKSLDQYLERLEAETASFSPAKANQRKSILATGPKCSSMESTSSILGGKHHLKSDVTGASTILKDSNIHTDVTAMSGEPTFSPARVRFSQPVSGRPESPVTNIHRSPSTDVVLDGDRSWEQAVPAYKSPVYVDDRQEISDALRSVKKSPSPTLTGRDQPGSMEALKNMLFRLQAEESTSLDTQNEEVSSSKEMRNPLDLPALQDYNFRVEPGGQSLEKALVHLSRLKSLVKTPKASSDTGSTISVATSLTQGSALTS